MRPLLIALLLAAATGGCGGVPADTGAADADHGEEHTALRDAVQEPLERARAVEDLAAGRKDELDEALQDAGAD